MSENKRNRNILSFTHKWKSGFMAGMIFFLLPLLTKAMPRPLPLTVSVFNESTAIPFTRLLTLPIHPGIQAGTEFNYRIKTHSRVFQTINLNYFYHNHLNQGIGAYSEIAYEYRFKSGIALTGLLGLGYMHTFNNAEEFTFENGKYVQKPDNGNARIYPSISIDAGYYFHKENPYSPKVFLRYQTWVEYPYSPGFIPVMTHINLHAGVKFFIHANDPVK